MHSRENYFVSGHIYKHDYFRLFVAELGPNAYVFSGYQSPSTVLNARVPFPP